MTADSALPRVLEQLLPLHDRLCPRQVLGARIGLQGGQLLGLTLPRDDKRLLTFVETDGCFADGVSVATGGSLGHRTLRVEDQGKVAATFVDTETGQAVRVLPRPGAREAALTYAPRGSGDRWLAQRAGYQCMPVDELLQWAPVHLSQALSEIISRPGLRVTCTVCGEEVLNGREVSRFNFTQCRSCAGQGYLQAEVRSSIAA